MSMIATTALSGRADGVRPHLTWRRPGKRKSRANRTPRYLSAHDWPPLTDDARYGPTQPREWPQWTDGLRFTITVEVKP